MKYDDAIEQVADYICSAAIDSSEAYQTAIDCLADALGCAILALKFKACTKLLGPVLPDTLVPNGSRVPGTHFILDPIRAAFNIGTMIRWLDYNDTWLAAEWGHPSDNFGGILAVADHQSRKTPLTVQDVLTAAIKAYEIQGGLAMLNSFNKIGFDHTILVKVATAGVAAHLLGGTKEQICAALSNAWLDTGPLRTYRHHPNTGSRKSWAAGDATSRGVQLAWWVLQGEMGYPSALTAQKWGFYDVLFHGTPFQFQRPLGSYVMENILFKISYPAEFHAQTAVECAIELHPRIKGKWDEIEAIEILTHESAIRIIDKTGLLKNPADRDHCLQYMTAIGLLKGDLTAEDYENEAAQNPWIDRLRQKMIVKENKKYSQDYHNPEKRSIANALTIRMVDGQVYGPIEKEYPIGHRRRRLEARPLLYEKLFNNLLTHFDRHQTLGIVDLFKNSNKLLQLSVHQLMDFLV